MCAWRALASASPLPINASARFGELGQPVGFPSSSAATAGMIAEWLSVEVSNSSGFLLVRQVVGVGAAVQLLQRAQVDSRSLARVRLCSLPAR